MTNELAYSDVELITAVKSYGEHASGMINVQQDILFNQWNKVIWIRNQHLETFPAQIYLWKFVDFLAYTIKNFFVSMNSLVKSVSLMTVNMIVQGPM
jgi:hypothetical protein